MKKFFFKIKGRQYDVEVKSLEDGIAQLDVNGTSYEVEVEQQEKKKFTPVMSRPAASSSAQSSAGSTSKPAVGGGAKGSIKAPLPGSIVKVNVNVGDSINVGQTVVVMEAMKMENNIQAEIAGTVKAIKANVGDTVMQDDVLIELG